MKPIGIGILAVVLAAGGQKSEEGERLLKAAMNRELVDGDLKGALEQYRKIAESGNRAAAAKALVRMGQCYEKLGDAEARKAYERVLREYSEQAAPAASARQRLAALTRASKLAPPGGVVHRLVWSTPTWAWGGVSSDGRWIAFQGEQGDLAICDLVTGQNRLLTNYGPRDKRPGEAEGGVFSPDGKKVAYQWREYKTDTPEIRVANLEGTGERTLYKNDRTSRAFPWAWTPDGAAVVASVIRTDLGEGQILRISAADGSVQVLRAEEASFRSMAFSPTGRFLAFTVRNNIHALDLQSPGGEKAPATLVGDGMENRLLGWSSDGSHILFVCDRTGARDAWLLPVQDGKPAGEPRLVKSGLAMSETYVPNAGSNLIPMGCTHAGACYYGVNRMDFDAMTVVLDPASGRLQGPPVRFIEGFNGTTYNLQWSPDGKRAFCHRGDMLFVRNLDPPSTRELHPPLNPLQTARWHPDGKSLIAIGYVRWEDHGVYDVDLETGAVRAIVLDSTESEMGRRTGRAVLSSDGKTLYRVMAEPQGGKWARGWVVARNLSSGEEKVIHRTRQDEGMVVDMALSPDGRQMATLNAPPFMPPRAMPRRIYVFPVSGEDPESPPLYAARESLGETFHAIAWLPDGKSLLAGMNRPLTTGELWRIPLDGGPPQTWPLPFMSFGLHVHPDGRRISITAWNQVTEVWALENFLPRETAAR